MKNEMKKEKETEREREERKKETHAHGSVLQGVAVLCQKKRQERK